MLLLWLVRPNAMARAQATAPAASAAGAGAAQPPPPTVLSTFKIQGYLQVDAVPFQQSSVDQLDPGSGQPLNEDRFSIPRAWLRASAQHGFVRGSVMLDANTVHGPSFGLYTAEGAIGYPAERPYVEIAGGLFLIPFGFETTELAYQRLFMEPSTWVTALFPGSRDLGARVGGEWSFLRYTLAAMNGNPAGDASFPERDPNRAKDILARVIARGPVGRRVELEIGASGLIGEGFHAGDPPTKDTVTFVDANEDGIAQPTELQRVAGNPGTPSKNFKRFGLGGQFALLMDLPVLGKGRIYGELVWAENLDRGLVPADPVTLGRNLRELGFMLAMRQAVTRHAEIGVRYDYYNPDQDASDRQGLHLVAKDAAFTTLGFVVGWCTLPYARLTVQYDHRTNPLGRSQSGKPTTLAMDSLTVRGQVEF
jgi:hypothetical protein